MKKLVTLTLILAIWLAHCTGAAADEIIWLPYYNGEA